MGVQADIQALPEQRRNSLLCAAPKNGRVGEAAGDIRGQRRIGLTNMVVIWLRPEPEKEKELIDIVLKQLGAELSE